jgi:hypothetical protein
MRGHNRAPWRHTSTVDRRGRYGGSSPGELIGHAKRKERVAPPPTTDVWDFRFATNEAIKGCEQIGSVAPANARAAWARITNDPRQRDARQHPLKDSLGSRVVDGTE